jgi:hypothetical protein
VLAAAVALVTVEAWLAPAAGAVVAGTAGGAVIAETAGGVVVAETAAGAVVAEAVWGPVVVPGASGAPAGVDGALPRAASD